MTPLVASLARLVLVTMAAVGIGWSLYTHQSFETGAAILAALGSLMAYVTVEGVQTTADETAKKLATVHEVINGRMEGMLTEARGKSRAEGILQGQGNPTGNTSDPPGPVQVQATIVNPTDPKETA